MSIGHHNVLAPRMRGQRPTRLACGQKPTEPKGPLFTAALAFAQLSLFVALLGPVMVSMALKVSTLTDDPTARTSMVGSVLTVGALAAMIGNALFGRLSDRTTSRFGRRRPWLVGGALVMAAALFAISQATGPGMLMAGWFVAQLGANAAFSPFIATLADQLPEKQYAKVSATVGIMQNVGVLVATWFASLFATDMLLLFMVPALVGVAGLVLYTLVLVPSSYLAGWLSDRTGHRKVPVALATVLFAVGTYLLMHVDSIAQFYLVEAPLGIAFGIYMSVDLALILEVLPNPEDTAKDLGVFNMANAMPQSLAPGLGAVLLAYGASGGEPHYGLLLGAAAAAALAGAFAGAFAVLPSRK